MKCIFYKLEDVVLPNCGGHSYQLFGFSTQVVSNAMAQHYIKMEWSEHWESSYGKCLASGIWNQYGVIEFSSKAFHVFAVDILSVKVFSNLVLKNWKY